MTLVCWIILMTLGIRTILVPGPISDVSRQLFTQRWPLQLPRQKKVRLFFESCHAQHFEPLHKDGPLAHAQTLREIIFAIIRHVVLRFELVGKMDFVFNHIIPIFGTIVDYTLRIIAGCSMK